MKKLDTMEYVDSPSGYVTLYSYKEPFMKFEGGYGYQGVLLMDGKTNDIQCHLCGSWFNYLPNHLHKEHNMTAEQYKEKVGLRQSSALVSEEARENMIRSGLNRRKANLKPGGKKTEEQKQKIRDTLKNVKRETQNERGTCPQQLIDRLRKEADRIGKVPPTKSLTFITTLKRVFGSYKEALRRAGLDTRKSGVNVRWEDITNEKLLEEIRYFYKLNGRRPTWSDIKRKTFRPGEIYNRRFGSFKKAIIKAIGKEGYEKSS